MAASSDVEQFNELADQIDKSIKEGESDVRSVDRELISSCLRRMATLRMAKIPPKLSKDTPFHITEIDAAIRQAFSIGSTWDEHARDEMFGKHISLLDLLAEGDPVNEEALIDAAIFVRAIIVGLELYRMKLESLRRSHKA